MHLVSKVYSSAVVRQNSIMAEVSLRQWWAVHGTTVLRVAIAAMALLALLKLGDEFQRLVWQPGYLGANDLKHRYQEISYWFAGKPVYSELWTATYPPAKLPDALATARLAAPHGGALALGGHHGRNARVVYPSDSAAKHGGY